MVIGCAHAGVPVVGPMGQFLSGFGAAGVPTSRGFRAVQIVAPTLD
jgi:hypothetical protein